MRREIRELNSRSIIIYNFESPQSFFHIFNPQLLQYIVTILCSSEHTNNTHLTQLTSSLYFVLFQVAFDDFLFAFREVRPLFENYANFILFQDVISSILVEADLLQNIKYNTQIFSCKDLGDFFSEASLITLNKTYSFLKFLHLQMKPIVTKNF